MISALPRAKFMYTVKTVRIDGARAEDLADFADALRKVARHVGKIIAKAPKSSGTRIDPDEPTQVPNTDLTVTFRVFPNDPRWVVSFTKFAATGQIKAKVPQFVFPNDLASVMQLAFVCDQASNLMKKY
jgi:hypothetical protein